MNLVFNLREDLNKKDRPAHFFKQAGSLTFGLALADLSLMNGKTFKNSAIDVKIPLPIQVVIDDVGWWSGADGSNLQQPYRTGIKRNHVPADYQAIADLGKKLDIRPQAATILCEWDRENILRNLPTSTWMREKWDNSKWVGPWLDEAAEIIRNNQKHYELTLHGVGHEYWEDANFTRAEWSDRSGRMRPLDQVELHLDYFAQLMEQNQLDPFPTSFVPTAFLHGFGVTGKHKISMAGVLKKRGITYINTPFYNMYNAQAVQYGLFGIDSDVITIDRGEDLFDWDIIGGKPDGTLSGPTCGLHWPNLLHEDPQRNSEIVDAWVKFLKPYNDKPGSLLAKDSFAFVNQLIHYKCTTTEIQGTDIFIDFSEAEKLSGQLTNNQLIIKIVSGKKLTFESDEIKISESKMLPGQDSIIYTLLLDRQSDNKKVKLKINNI